MSRTAKEQAEDVAQIAVREFIADVALRTHVHHPMFTAEHLDMWGAGSSGARTVVTCTDASLVVLLRSFARRR